MTVLKFEKPLFRKNKPQNQQREHDAQLPSDKYNDIGWLFINILVRNSLYTSVETVLEVDREIAAKLSNQLDIDKIVDSFYLSTIGCCSKEVLDEVVNFMYDDRYKLYEVAIRTALFENEELFGESIALLLAPTTTKH